MSRADPDRTAGGRTGATSASAPSPSGRGGPAMAAAVLALAAAAACFLSLRLGAVEIPTGDLLSILAGGEPDSEFLSSRDARFIVLQLRLPRALMGLLVGGGLAVSGAVFQALLRNPLAEPYILGISGGSAAAALLALALGWVAAATWALPIAALAGAGAAILLVFGVALSADRRMDVRVLLLSGVVVGAFFTAGIALILAVSDAPTVRSAVLWMMGSLSGVSWGDVGIVAAYTLPTAVGLLAIARPLDLMAIGEETASYLGANVERTKRIAYAAASLLTAAGVAFAGVIGFVGLVVPHAVRLAVASDHRSVLPLSFLAGAAFLTFADLVARVAVAPTEIPIGVVTAFLGVPFFLVLLRRSLRP